MLSEKDKLRIANESNLKQWQRGQKQMEESEKRKQQMREAKDAPFSTSALSKEAENEMKQKERFGDPLKLIKSKTVQANSN